MKRGKQVLPAVLAVMMILAVLPLPAFAAGSLSNFRTVNTYWNGLFADVEYNEWYTDGVRSAYELGLMKGTDDRAFSPKSTLTLAEVVTMAARIHSIYYSGSENFQPGGSAWYSAYVDYAKRNGIIDRDYANYSATATRAQFASILARALPGSALPKINDIEDGAIPDVSAYHSSAKEIYLLYRAGVLIGSDDSLTFRPNTSIQRSEVAQIVTRMALTSKRVKLTVQTASAYTWQGDSSLDFTVELTDGRSFTLSEQAGKVVLVNFWATWCGPCTREMPDLETLYQEYRSGGQVEIILVNCGENSRTVESFLSRNGYTMPVACDPYGNISDAYGVSAIPRTVIFGKDGRVTKEYTGTQSYNTFKLAIDIALRG